MIVTKQFTEEGAALLRSNNVCNYNSLQLHSNRMAAPVTKEISYEDLKALVGKSQNLLLVDVRSKEEFERGQIPGSVHIPVDTVDEAFALEPEAFKAKYGVTKPPLDAPELVFHCQMGRRGAFATDKACKLGYVNARNYAGAFKEWSERAAK